MQRVSKPFDAVYLRDCTARVYTPLGDGFSLCSETAPFWRVLLGRSAVVAQASGSSDEQRKAGVGCVLAPQAADHSVWAQSGDEAGAQVPDKVFCSSSHEYLI